METSRIDMHVTALSDSRSFADGGKTFEHSAADRGPEATYHVLAAAVMHTDAP